MRNLRRGASLQPIAVIPARGGSKRIQRKNLRRISGRPLLSITIQNLQESEIFDSIYVSTDDYEIAETATKEGALVPFLREKNLADDFTGTHDVVSDFLTRLEKEKAPQERLVCCVYPTAFLLDTSDIIQSFHIAQKTPDVSVIGVVKTPFAPQRVLKRNSLGFGTYLYPEHQFSRTQDLSETFSDAGQFYWGSVSVWSRDRSAKINRYLYELPRMRAVDIDDEMDLQIAEALFEFKKKTLHGSSHLAGKKPGRDQQTGLAVEA